MPKRKIRVALIKHTPYKLSSLNDAISSQQDMELLCVGQPLASAWGRIITISPDITLVYCSSFGQQELDAVNKLLRSTLSKILLLSREHVAVRDDRLEIIELAGSELSINGRSWDDVLDVIRSAANADKAPTIDPASLKRQDSEQRIPPGVLNSYVIAIGASTGGTEALAKLFRLLPDSMPGIVVVQHMPPVFTRLYAERLNSELPFSVTEAGNNVPIQPGTIHIAPGDRHLTIQKFNGSFHTRLGSTEKVGGHCPSVNVLFESVAKVAGKHAVGVILTGMGSDGADGMLSMRKSGVYTLGQDEASSVVYGMPKQAFDNGSVAKQASLTDIPRLLVDFLSKKAEAV